MNETHSTTGRNQNMNVTIEKLKEDNREEMKKNMKILELKENENEALKQKFEIFEMIELKIAKKEEKTVGETSIDETNNETAKGGNLRYTSVKERLAWGFKRYLQGENTIGLYMGRSKNGMKAWLL